MCINSISQPPIWLENLQKHEVCLTCIRVALVALLIGGAATSMVALSGHVSYQIGIPAGVTTFIATVLLSLSFMKRTDAQNSTPVQTNIPVQTREPSLQISHPLPDKVSVNFNADYKLTTLFENITQEIPIEIEKAILSFLSPKELAKSLLVSKKWNFFIGAQFRSLSLYQLAFLVKKHGPGKLNIEHSLIPYLAELDFNLAIEHAKHITTFPIETFEKLEKFVDTPDKLLKLVELAAPRTTLVEAIPLLALLIRVMKKTFAGKDFETHLSFFKKIGRLRRFQIYVVLSMLEQFPAQTASIWHTAKIHLNLPQFKEESLDFIYSDFSADTLLALLRLLNQSLDNYWFLFCNKTRQLNKKDYISILNAAGTDSRALLTCLTLINCDDFNLVDFLPFRPILTEKDLSHFYEILFDRHSDKISLVKSLSESPVSATRDQVIDEVLQLLPESDFSDELYNFFEAKISTVRIPGATLRYYETYWDESALDKLLKDSQIESCPDYVFAKLILHKSELQKGEEAFHLVEHFRDKELKLKIYVLIASYYIMKNELKPVDDLLAKIGQMGGLEANIIHKSLSEILCILSQKNVKQALDWAEKNIKPEHLPILYVQIALEQKKVSQPYLPLLFAARQLSHHLNGKPDQLIVFLNLCSEVQS